MTPPKTPAPPKGLSSRARGLWRAVLADFDLSGHELTILEEACRSLDRADEARVEVEKHGTVTKDRFGQLKANPAAAVERDMRGLAVRCLRELSLDPNTIDPARPPRIPGRYDD